MNLDEMRRLDATKTYKELEESKAEIDRLRKANFQLREGAEEQKQRIQRLEEALDTLTCVIGLTPIVSNREALREAFDMARSALKSKEAKP